MASKPSTSSAVKRQRQALVRNIEKFWDSARTHLPYTITRTKPGEDPRQFHVDTIIEYLEDMLAAAKALR